MTAVPSSGHVYYPVAEKKFISNSLAFYAGGFHCLDENRWKIGMLEKQSHKLRPVGCKPVNFVFSLYFLFVVIYMPKTVNIVSPFDHIWLYVCSEGVNRGNF